MAQMVDILLMQSFAGGIVIAAILLARRFLLRRARAQWMYALWLIAALRLLAPLQLPAPWLSADASPIWAPETVVVSFSERPAGRRRRPGRQAARQRNPLRAHRPLRLPRAPLKPHPPLPLPLRMLHPGKKPHLACGWPARCLRRRTYAPSTRVVTPG